MWKSKSVGLIALVIFGVTGCGTGVIRFQDRNGGPPAPSGTEAQRFDLECKDTITDNPDGSYVHDGKRVSYNDDCSWQGKGMPWKVLGYFHCAPLAHGKWDQYRQEVAAKATSKGCPGVAIRKMPPLVNDGGEAVGAYCIDPSKPN